MFCRPFEFKYRMLFIVFIVCIVTEPCGRMSLALAPSFIDHDVKARGAASLYMKVPRFLKSSGETSTIRFCTALSELSRSELYRSELSFGLGIPFHTWQTHLGPNGFHNTRGHAPAGHAGA